MAGGDDERAGQACRELTRLLNLDRDVPVEALLRGFADPEQRALLSRPGCPPAEIAAQLHQLAAGSPEAASPPTGAALGVAVAGFWDWARTGFGVVDADTAGRRLAACGVCHEFRPAPGSLLHMMSAAALGVPKDARVCRHCGCFMEKKVRQASAVCPEPDPGQPGLSRWGDPLPQAAGPGS